MDIRIVRVVTTQPTLFGEPIKETTFRLVNWETNTPVNTTCYPSMGEAERASLDLLRDELNRMASLAEMTIDESSAGEPASSHSQGYTKPGK